MKMSLRALIIGAIATAVIAPRAFALDAPASPADKKAESTKAPAKPAAKAPAAKAEAKSDSALTPGTGVSKQNNVNVRGQASINSEVVGHLQKNEPVSILEEVTLKKPKQDEPARWYRIAVPTNVSVWVHSSFIDAVTKTVKPNRLNLRGGPGENYSILGRLDKGATIKELDTKNEWVKIEPPTNSFAFVAAHLVERTVAPAIVVTPPVIEQPAVTNPPPVIAEVPPTTPPVAPPTTPVTPPPAEATTPVTTTPPVITPPAVPEAPIEKVKKIVSREGVLKGSVSIQAPSHFELRSLDTQKTINYVFSPSPDLSLKQFKGKRIVVTGEELLDERWQSTPVIIVDSLEVVP